MRAYKTVKENLLSIVASLLLLSGLVSAVFPPAYALAEGSVPAPSITFADSTICPNKNGHNSCNLPTTTADKSTIKTILQIAFGIIGAFALLSVSLSGFKYITAAGNPQKTSEAKSGVAYAIVGLMIAIAAEAIVAFVVHRGAP